jgi:integrase
MLCACPGTSSDALLNPLTSGFFEGKFKGNLPALKKGYPYRGKKLPTKGGPAMLTDTRIRNAKPAKKQYKLADSRGLFLLVSKNGGKWWRLRYRFDGREKMLSLGVFPETGLSQAREKRNEARKLIAAGIDPSDRRKAEKAAEAQNSNTFELVAREWHTKFTPTWEAKHAEAIIRRLERDAFPWIGSNPIAGITAPQVLSVLRRIEGRGALETAHRIRVICSQVFRYGIATGRCERDPAADLRGALPPTRKKHMAAITNPQEVGGLLRSIDAYQGSFVVKCALRLAPLVFVRPKELRTAEWAEIDLEAAEWSIPDCKMKTHAPLLVPLAQQAVEILKELHPLTSSGRYVFPNHRTPQKPMSNMAVLAALRYLGYEKHEMTGHGFRALARTALDEQLHFPPHLIEAQLAHVVCDPLGRAYNRTQHLPERRRMMQAWADYLDTLRSGGKVIPFQRQSA